jgi:hypothetical protein
MNDVLASVWSPRTFSALSKYRGISSTESKTESVSQRSLEQGLKYSPESLSPAIWQEVGAPEQALILHISSILNKAEDSEWLLTVLPRIDMKHRDR